MRNNIKAVIVTLFEGEYHYGLGVLINSLVANGFRGAIFAGYRAPLPPWCAQLRRFERDNPRFQVTHDCELVFVPIDYDEHPANCKPKFVLNILDNHAGDAQSAFFFDPDIVVRCRWDFFDQWVREGVALCEDVNWRMPNDHPIRNAWRRIFKSKGIELPNQRDAYYNSGFVGVTRAHVSFWREWCEILEQCSYDRSCFNQHDRVNAFSNCDQDALNITTMMTELPLSTIGPDGMDFRYGGGGYVMCHAVGRYKPWNHSYIWAAIAKGRRLARVEREFLKYANGPIRVFSRTRYVLKSIDRSLAGAISRIVS